MKTRRLIRERHPDDLSFFDEVKIELRERYKTSGLSGDEWRFSWLIRCYRKGRCLVERRCGGHVSEYAGIIAAEALALGGETTMGAPRWEIVEKWDPSMEDGVCCQPGCCEPASVRYRMKKRFDRSCRYSEPILDDEIRYREFCHKHADRGDAGLDDGPSNYELMEGTAH